MATEPAFSFSNERILPIERLVIAVNQRDYDMHPDGERFLMAFPVDADDNRPKIRVALNWTQELLERVPVD